MLKKTITYTNPFTEQQVSEDHYFHISKADIIQMEMEVHKDTHTNKDGQQLTGMQAKMQKIVESEDGKAIMEELRDFVRRSYGRRDGDRFLKSSAIWEEFASTEAYSQLIWDLCTDAEQAGIFINSVVPSDLEQIAAEVRAIAEKEATGEGGTVTELKSPTAISAEASTGLEEPVSEKPEPRVITTAEASGMDPNELQAGLKDGRYKLS